MVSRIHLLASIVALISGQCISAWSTNSQPFQTAPRRKHQQSQAPLVVTTTVDSPAVRDESATQHYMLREGGLFQDAKRTTASTSSKSSSSPSNRRRTITFSHSVAGRDNAFTTGGPIAHGLLSPHTVARLEELTRLRRHNSAALDSFLDSYYTKGPMSCVHMLSDPSILPHLTSAMRDIAA